MPFLRVGLVALCATAITELGSAQSTLMTALESSAPAPIIEPTLAALTRGLPGVWTDPTADPRVTGVFFAIQHASYASVQVFHGAFAFRLGPRWSVAYASAGLGELFDSSLTSQDPGLSSLRAQATWGRLDATIALPRLAASLGLSVVGDDNVGVIETSTLGRAHIRIVPFPSGRVTIGVQGSRSIGGSVPMSGAGRQSIDLTIRRPLGASSISVTAAASRGALWRYSETDAAYGIAGQLTVHSLLDIGAGVTRYSTTYGTSAIAWCRSVTAAIRIGGLRVGTRYASTRIGIGSGFALSLGYESARAGAGHLSNE